MQDKTFLGMIGFISIIVSSMPMYNYYLSPVVRHKDILDKIDALDKRLKNLEK